MHVAVCASLSTTPPPPMGLDRMEALRSDIVVEPFNAVLSFHQRVENPDGYMVSDSDVLYNVCFRAHNVTLSLLTGLESLGGRVTTRSNSRAS